jgi:hypothetical protein
MHSVYIHALFGSTIHTLVSEFYKPCWLSDGYGVKRMFCSQLSIKESLSDVEMDLLLATAQH